MPRGVFALSVDDGSVCVCDCGHLLRGLDLQSNRVGPTRLTVCMCMGRKITLTQASKGHNVRLIIRKQMLKRKNTERHRADSLWSLLMSSSFEWGTLTGFAVNNLHQLCLPTKDESEKCVVLT